MQKTCLMDQESQQAWSAAKVFRLGNVVKFTTGLGVTTYYTPTKEHTSSATFGAAEIAENWRVIDGPALYYKT